MEVFLMNKLTKIFIINCALLASGTLSAHDGFRTCPCEERSPFYESATYLNNQNPRISMQGMARFLLELQITGMKPKKTYASAGKIETKTLTEITQTAALGFLLNLQTKPIKISIETKIYLKGIAMIKMSTHKTAAIRM